MSKKREQLRLLSEYGAMWRDIRTAPRRGVDRETLERMRSEARKVSDRLSTQDVVNIQRRIEEELAAEGGANEKAGDGSP